MVRTMALAYFPAPASEIKQPSHLLAALTFSLLQEIILPESNNFTLL